jgi:uncharacterized 2Fe-2S/4Fe-4S cluster protein (DUF4445 family)
MPRITVIHPAGRQVTIQAAADQTLAQVVYTSGPELGLQPPALCSGLGRCGRCRMRYIEPEAAPAPLDAERLALTEEELALGWRLGCRHLPAEAQGDALTVELPPLPAPHVGPDEAVPEHPGALLLAVDLGTTTLHWQALARDGVAAAGQEINPQMGAGSEVMSRLAFAARPGGAERLRELTLERLAAIVAGLGGPERVAGMCVAANTAMTCLLLGKDVAGLARAPYRLPWAGGERVTPGHGLPEALIPPQFAPFVGGDVAAGLMHLLHGLDEVDRPRFPFILADMGTNGEVVLALSPEEFLAASVPLGPALEGVGLSCGAVAGQGEAAVVRYSMGPKGLQPVVQGDGPPRGVSGTGYLSLCRLLVQSRFLDREGRLQPEPATPLGRRLAERVAEVRGEPRLDLGHGLYLVPRDVEELLKVKAAFNLALSRLLDEVGLAPGDVTALCLAGALGEHVGQRDLEALGFIPAGMAGALRVAGNASLAGARLFLEKPGTMDAALRVAARVGVLGLAEEEDFGPAYLRRMVFDYVP